MTPKKVTHDKFVETYLYLEDYEMMAEIKETQEEEPDSTRGVVVIDLFAD